MIANFKREDKNKIIVIGADKAEAILIQNLVGESKKVDKKLSMTEYFDVEGNVNGFALILEDVEQESNEPTDDNTEETNNSETVENNEEVNNEEQSENNVVEENNEEGE